MQPQSKPPLRQPRPPMAQKPLARPLARPGASAGRQYLANFVASPPKFKGFGITFMVINGLVGLLLVVMAPMLASVFSGSSSPLAGPETQRAVQLVSTILLVIGVAYLGTAIGVGVFSIRGSIVALWIGLAFSGLNAMGAISGLASGKGGGGVVPLALHGLLIGLAITDMKRHNAYKAMKAGQIPGGPAYGAPPYGAPPPYGAMPYGSPPQYGAPPQYSAPPYEVPPQPPPAPEVPAEEITMVEEPPVLSPRDAALQLLSLAASVDPAQATMRLQRARRVGAKLLGEAAVAQVNAALAAPAAVDDPAGRAAQLVGALGAPRMKQNTRVAVEFILKQGEGLPPEAQPILAAFDAL